MEEKLRLINSIANNATSLIKTASSKKDYENAEKLFDDALKVKESAFIRILKAKLYRRLGQYEDAKNELQLGLQHLKSNSNEYTALLAADYKNEIFLTLAQIYASLYDFSKAHESINNIDIKKFINKGNVNLFLTLKAWVFLLENKFTEARLAAQDVLKSDLIDDKLIIEEMITFAEKSKNLNSNDQRKNDYLQLTQRYKNEKISEIAYSELTIFRLDYYHFAAKSSLLPIEAWQITQAILLERKTAVKDSFHYHYESSLFLHRLGRVVGLDIAGLIDNQIQYNANKGSSFEKLSLGLSSRYEYSSKEWTPLTYSVWFVDAQSVNKFFKSPVGTEEKKIFGMKNLLKVLVSSPFIALESEASVMEVASLIIQYDKNVLNELIQDRFSLSSLIEQNDFAKSMLAETIVSKLKDYIESQLNAYSQEIEAVENIVINDDLESLQNSPKLSKLLNSFQTSNGENLFLLAVKHKSLAIFKDLIASSKKHVSAINNITDFVNMQNNQGDTALHLCVKHDNLKFLVDIMNHPTFIGQKARNAHGITPLHAAIMHNKLAITKVLRMKYEDFDCGAKILDYSHDEFSPIQTAVIYNRGEIIKLFKDEELLNAGHSSYGNLINLAIQFDSHDAFNSLINVKKMDTLLKFKNNIPHLNNATSYLKHPIEIKEITPLAHAALLGRVNFIESFLLMGVDIDQTSYNGYTAFHLAILGNSLDSVELLCSLDLHKTLLNIPSTSGQYPHSLAESLKNQDQQFIGVYNRVNDMVRSRDSYCKYKIEETEIENIVLDGGGPRGLAYIGALKKLNEHGKLKSIKRYAGASAGAITTGMLGIGLSPDQIYNYTNSKPLSSLLDWFDDKIKLDILKSKFSQTIEPFARENETRSSLLISLIKLAFKEVMTAFNIRDDGLYNLVSGALQKKYFCHGEEARKWFEDIIKQKTGVQFFTLGDLRRNVQNRVEGYKHVKIYVTRIEIDSNGNEIIDSVELSSEDPSQGDLIYSDIIRASMSIPIVFAPHRLYRRDPRTNNRVVDNQDIIYFDGGVLNNFPIEAFDTYAVNLNGQISYRHFMNPKTIGFNLLTAEEYQQFYPSNNQDISDQNRHNEGLVGVAISMINAFYTNEQLTKEKKITNRLRTIGIYDEGVGLLDFDIDDTVKRKLIVSGERSLANYLEKRHELQESVSPPNNPSNNVRQRSTPASRKTVPSLTLYHHVFTILSSTISVALIDYNYVSGACCHRSKIRSLILGSIIGPVSYYSLHKIIPNTLPHAEARSIPNYQDCPPVNSMLIAKIDPHFRTNFENPSTKASIKYNFTNNFIGNIMLIFLFYSLILSLVKTLSSSKKNYTVSNQRRLRRNELALRLSLLSNKINQDDINLPGQLKSWFQWSIEDFMHDLSNAKHTNSIQLIGDIDHFTNEVKACIEYYNEHNNILTDEKSRQLRTHKMFSFYDEWQPRSEELSNVLKSASSPTKLELK